MAISTARLHISALTAPVSLPPWVLLCAVAAPSADFLAMLQGLPALKAASLVLTLFATAGVWLEVAHHSRSAWLFMAALSLGVSLATRVTGLPESAAFGLAALVVLGLAGAFREAPAPTTRRSTRHQAESAQPLPLARPA